MEEIRVFDPHTEEVFTERVYGGAFVRAAYSYPVVKQIVGLSTFQKTLSKFVGLMKKSAFSRKQIEKFIASYDIDMNDFESPDTGYKTFNDFFVRKKRRISF